MLPIHRNVSLLYLNHNNTLCLNYLLLAPANTQLAHDYLTFADVTLLSI